jgi:hypothetical protein
MHHPQILKLSQSIQIRYIFTQFYPLIFPKSHKNKEVFVKLVSSSGGGQINNAWFPFADVLKQLEKYSEGGSFTSTTIFSPIFTNVSSNMAGFTLAMALKEKLVIPKQGMQRKFIYDSPAAFLAKVEKLIATKAIKKSPRRKTKATA